MGSSGSTSTLGDVGSRPGVVDFPTLPKLHYYYILSLPKVFLILESGSNNLINCWGHTLKNLGMYAIRSR